MSNDMLSDLVNFFTKYVTTSSAIFSYCRHCAIA